MTISNRLRAITVELSALKSLAPGVRRHSKKQLTKIQDGLKQHGLLRPILISPDHQVIDGELLCEALLANGATTVAAVVVDGLQPAELRTLRLFLNRTSADAGWDVERLDAEFSFIRGAGIDLSKTGFDSDELILIDDTLSPRQQTIAFNEAASPSPICVMGDIWRCGDHVIGCGDVSDQAFVDQVRSGIGITVSILDLVNSNQSSNDPFHAADHATIDNATSFDSFTGLLALARTATSLDGLVFVVVDRRQLLQLGVAGHACGLKLADICVLITETTISAGLYKNAFYAIAIFQTNETVIALKPRKRRSRRNVWTYPRSGSDLSHCESRSPWRSVAFIADLLLDSTTKGDAVFDPSMGSGATLLAAHRTGRRCIGIERNAELVGEAIHRWQSATGLKAENISNGRMSTQNQQAPIDVLPKLQI